ncbi:peptidylprolyl isomerase [Nitrosovibrio sp. Nv6]|uniref:peptidylprolyl isomerase n=1 Tax=Nitrosovibrio sp. Nv6 TaxID=1855340 RepID=UPI0008C2D5A4|nr:peptidylprolyl isomerase [Nitrosovibrio sp. Nv6]SEO73880.1 peptidyl-prolyl cis-trans isomerase A (cyclophilin A)/peptidyl-prolyl cis-trans isomerase B (cyclophilin B) [Nitrosovibrio sp. Nv6]
MPINKVLAVFSLLFFSAATYAANPLVEIKTNLGSIVVELYPDKAPKTVQNFLSYVKDDYYTGTVFHRVIPGFMIQGGGFEKTLKQKPARPPIENEAANGLRNETGTIAMARTSDPHSASAQFFINVANNAFLNHTAPTARGYGYTVFGKVVKGMEVVNRIAEAPTGPAGPFPADVPNVTVVIEKIKRIPTEPSPVLVH